MANRWRNNGNSARFYFGGGSKITEDGDRSHEIKRHLLLVRKAMTNLDNILKSRDITLPTNGFSIAGSYRKLSTKELMLLNCGVGEDS